MRIEPDHNEVHTCTAGDAETFQMMRDGGYEPRGQQCAEEAEPHSFLCADHGGESDTDEFALNWQEYIDQEEHVCQCIREEATSEVIAEWIESLPESHRK